MQVSSSSFHYCSCLPREGAFYIGVVVPFTVAICLSLCTVMMSCYLSYKMSTQLNRRHWTQLVMVSIIFTIGWIFGLAEADASSALTAAVLELIYSITFGLLGVYVFTLYCIVPPNIRRMLLLKKEVGSPSKNSTNSKKWSRNVKGTSSTQKLTSLTRNNNGEEEATPVDSPSVIVHNDGYLSQLNSPSKIPQQEGNPPENETVDL